MTYLYLPMNMPKIFVIDAGNTALKVAAIQDNKVLFSERLDKDDLEALHDLYDPTQCHGIALTSVRSEEWDQQLIGTFSGQKIYVLDNSRFKGFPIDYDSPKSLGKDRLCNAAAAHFLSKTAFALSIDVGTCIKFDLIDKKLGYLGGSISPGMHLRYRALHTFTDNLPLINETKNIEHVGKSTAQSISSGVLNGIESEINGMITKYEEKYPDLTIFVTGGDHRFFDIVAKNDIFAHENLTIIGLYQIYLQSV